jgi:hypothetical protein
MAVRPVGGELFHVDGQTDTTKLLVVIRNSANAHINTTICRAINAVTQTTGHACNTLLIIIHSTNSRSSVRPSRSVSKTLAVTVQHFQHKGRSSWRGTPIEIIAFLIPKIRHLSNSKEDKISSEASSSSASQDISRTSWKSKVHYRAHNSSSVVPVPSHINPLHALPSYFLQLRFNIIIPSMPRSFEWSLSLKFPYRNSLYIPPRPHTYRQSHSPWFGTRIIFGEQYRS